MSDRVLRVEGLRLSRGPREILSGASLSVAAGELVALMGPSGSGKTTLLRAIAGLEPFAAGRIAVGDAVLAPATRPSAARQALRGTVGMVFQFHCLFEHLPALTNVWLAPVHAHGVARPEAERRARTLLDRLGVGHRAKALPRELSGGEAQRVAIARALAVEPSILLMDEPTASLDPERRTELSELLAGLGRERRTIVVATHDEDFARSCATRILRIREGGVTPSPAG